MLNRKTFVLSSIIILLTMVMIFSQRQIQAAPTAVTATGNWSVPKLLSGAADDAQNPVIKQDSAGNMIVVYNSGTGEYKVDTAVNRMWDQSTSTWANEASIYGDNIDNVTVDVVYDSTDKAHAVWVHNTEQVYYADEGAWPTTFTTIQANPGVNVVNSVMAIDSQDNLHVAWVELNVGMFIHYASYTNSTSTWLPPVIITETGSLITPPTIAVDDSGTVHIAWASMSDNDPKVFYKNNDGGDWSVPARELSETFFPATSPFLLADGNLVHLSFTYKSSEDVQQIYYVELSDSDSWSGTVPISIGSTFYSHENIGVTSSIATCGDTLHIYHYGKTTVSGVAEQVWEISKKGDGAWSTNSTMVTNAEGNTRTINPYAVCSGGSVYLVYEEIPDNKLAHTIQYIYSSNSIYLPVILK